ncbi:OmpA family protein [Chitinophaga rhizophila]|uniref:OmpA family protein n=1 Tax=Chitinophaga rhizophila TaxID=2866212 RepID=A0ABS7GA26_9BACT|nr:OmpA family protein [Chitinophaga rhizophila]MBW8684513.1 OmpA family protein [Chitinophaga rhizophila]
MNRKHYTLPALLSTLLLTGMLNTASGQYVIKAADTEASLYNYAAAIPLYHKAFDRKETVNAARGLATSYRLLKDYPAAATWYEKLVAMPEHTSEDELYYAAILMNNEQYNAAKQVLAGYLAKVPGDQKAETMKAGCDSAAVWLSSPIRGDLENLKGLNSEWSDWSTAFRDGKVIFASDRPYDSLRPDALFNRSNIKRKYYGYTGNSYLHLYESNGLDSGTAKLLVRDVNGDYHSAHASYTGNGQTLYYSVTELARKKGSFLGKETPYTLNVEIRGQQWDTATRAWNVLPEFPFNEIFNHSIGDPFITPDGKTLLFVADYGDKGNGGTDIYYSTKDASGQWQTPVNIGAAINTAGNERSPLLDQNGILYFSTDGRPGLGGLDIFSAVKENGSWVARNMGVPVNSAQDDFAPAYNGTNTLYFSSNRKGGKGSDDLYRFTPAKILVFSLEGKALDKKTNQPLADANVSLANKETGAVLTVTTDSRGDFHFALDSLSAYGLEGGKALFRPASEVAVVTKGLTESAVLHRDLYLEKIEVATVVNKPKDPVPVKGIGVAKKIDLGTKFNAQNIYFDLGKADIRPDVAKELDKLIALMKENPSWKVDMSFHTDSRSDDNYNLKLSQRRAASTLNYFLSKGIDKKRLAAKGYGETKLINRCANGVNCTEAEHQANRRAEFNVLER